MSKFLIIFLFLSFSSTVFSLDVSCQKKIEAICGNKSLEACLKDNAKMFGPDDQSCLTSYAEEEVKKVSQKNERCLKVIERVCSKGEDEIDKCLEKNSRLIPSDCHSYLKKAQKPQVTNLVQSLQSTSCFQKLMQKCPMDNIDVNNIEKFQANQLKCFSTQMAKMKGECEKEFKKLKGF